MKIIVRPERCISSGNCALAAPKLFAQDDEGVVVALVTEPDPADYAVAREAAALCPVIAIALQDEAGA